MDQHHHRPRAATEYRPRQSGIESRPDKIALWAVVLAVVAMIAGATSARADSGSPVPDANPPASSAPAPSTAG
jgi:hypothetical protein